MMTHAFCRCLRRIWPSRSVVAGCPDIRVRSTPDWLLRRGARSFRNFRFAISCRLPEQGRAATRPEVAAKPAFLACCALFCSIPLARTPTIACGTPASASKARANRVWRLGLDSTNKKWPRFQNFVTSARRFFLRALPFPAIRLAHPSGTNFRTLLAGTDVHRLK